MPLKRLLKPIDIAKVALSLCSPLSDALCGETIPCQRRSRAAQSLLIGSFFSGKRPVYCTVLSHFRRKVNFCIFTFPKRHVILKHVINCNI